MCLPGVLAPFHWTVSSPVPGLDSRLRSVGGDRARDEEEKEESEEEKNKRKKGHRVNVYWCFLTCDNAACDRGSLLVTVYDRLDAVGVLHSWSQTRNVNASGVRGHVSGGFSALTGTHCQLKDKCTQSETQQRQRRGLRGYRR